MGILDWWSKRQRRKYLSAPTPHRWNEWLHRLWFFRRLTASQQQAVLETTKILVAEKNWEGCGGLKMTDDIRVTIAAQIGWLVVGIGPEYFDTVESILVYPDAYVAPGKEITSGGVVFEGDSARQGEAWYRGPVVLSWDDVKAGGFSTNHGHNLVLHEFAHQLDMLNGRDADGVPTIEDNEFAQRWLEVMKREFDLLSSNCELGRPTLLDCYGTTNRAEFFAVATETFFQYPDRLRSQHGDLFNILSKYYRI